MQFGPRTRGYASAYSLTGPLHVHRMNDVVVENFHERVQSGELICNPMDSIRYYCSGPNFARMTCDHTRTYTSNGVKYYTSNRKVDASRYMVIYASNLQHTFLSDWAVSRMNEWALSSFSQNEQNLLNAQVDAKIGSGLAQLYVTAMESRKTVNMLAKAVSLLRQEISSVARSLRVTRREMLTPEGRNRVLNKVGDYWLEGRYGWRPFVLDVMNTFEGLIKGGRSVRFTARGTIIRNYEEDKTIYSSAPTTFMGAAKHTMKLEAFRRLRAGSTVDYQLDTSNSTAFLHGATDVLGSAWELVRFSFVLDWFINVGDVLQAIQAYALVDKRVAWLTEDIEILATHSLRIDPPYEYTYNGTIYRWELGTLFGAGTFYEVLKVRKRTPRVNFNPAFGYRFNMDWAKALDSIFLLKKVLGVSTRI